MNIVQEISVSDSNNDYSTLETFLCRAVRLTKNADFDNYKYSEYGIVFDRRRTFSCPSGGFGCNVIFFGVDMSSSIHLDNSKNIF